MLRTNPFAIFCLCWISYEQLAFAVAADTQESVQNIEPTKSTGVRSSSGTNIANADATTHGGQHEIANYEIAHVDWHHVETPFTIALWLLLAGFAKIVFHLSKKFASVCPDSSLLILIGLVVGGVLFWIVKDVDEQKYHLGSEIFFIYLLPPIVFDAGYFMPNRAFFDNLGTILVYAVIGTLWNTVTIGLSLYGVGQTGLFKQPTPILEVFIFSSLISAVDPVAVLVVFEAVHVNEILYITVFGESLLNDAVTVVLYNMFKSFQDIGEDNISVSDVGKGIVSFFVVGLGGVLIGLIWAFLVSLTTRYTKHVRVLEPMFIFIMAYCSYLTAELFHLSGILAIVFCGIAMKQYVERNISSNSQTTVTYFLKMLSSSSETVIFMFLGLSTVTKNHDFDTAFVCLTVLFCLVYRAIGVIVLTFFVNKGRMVKLSKVEQFIMAYGGLRGAIAYGLVVALDDKIPAKEMFVTTTVVVIYFTVFLQGMTIKPLVNFLKVKRADSRERTMNEMIFERLSHHTLAAIEDIVGHSGGHNRLRARYEYYDNKFLRPLLMRDPPKSQNIHIVETFTQLNLREAKAQLEKHGKLKPAAAPNTESLASILRSRSANQLASLDNEVNDQPVLDLRSIEFKGIDNEEYHHKWDERQPLPQLRQRRYSRHYETLEEDSTSYDSSGSKNRKDSHFSEPYPVPRKKSSRQNFQTRYGRDAEGNVFEIREKDKHRKTERRASDFAVVSRPVQQPKAVKFILTHVDEDEADDGLHYGEDNPAFLPTRRFSLGNEEIYPVDNTLMRSLMPLDSREREDLTAAEKEFPWKRSDDSTPLHIKRGSVISEASHNFDEPPFSPSSGPDGAPINHMGLFVLSEEPLPYHGHENPVFDDGAEARRHHALDYQSSGSKDQEPPPESPDLSENTTKVTIEGPEDEAQTSTAANIATTESQRF